MTSDPLRYGKEAEKAAEAHLSRKGYRILGRNVRYPQGELDIVAEVGETVVFVEVKARRSDTFGGPAYSVTRLKEQKLVQLASLYIGQHRLEDRPCRFDVILIQGDIPRSSSLEHIENAFEMTNPG